MSADYLVPNNFVCTTKRTRVTAFCKHANSRRTRSFQRPYRIWIEIIDAKYQTTCNTNMELSGAYYLNMLSTMQLHTTFLEWNGPIMFQLNMLHSLSLSKISTHHLSSLSLSISNMRYIDFWSVIRRRRVGPLHINSHKSHLFSPSAGWASPIPPPWDFRSWQRYLNVAPPLILGISNLFSWL